MDVSLPVLARPERLRCADYLLLSIFCLVLFGYAVVGGRRLTGHESVIPETAREMLANHDWLVPRMGGEPWLERPPLSAWVLAGIDALFGDAASDQLARVAPVCLALSVVLLSAWMACRWYGRAVGMLGGLILATMWEFFSFASDPEADIFLCAIVTAALALFVRLEWPASEKKDFRLFSGRCLAVLAFFILLGMTNLAKGLIFGTLMVLVPVASFLLWNADLSRLRRYVWFWGGLAFLVVSLAWPIATYVQYPAIMDLWKMHYLGRLYQGYIGEPAWYYVVTVPFVLLPWSLVALAGLWWTRRQAVRQRYSPERFLWCWAVMVPVVFSIPNGKHHHYLLHSLAPWAILAALAAQRLWQMVQQSSLRLRQPILAAALIGAALDLALLAQRHRIGGPDWVLPAMLLGVPALVCAFCWSACRKDARLASAGVFGVLLVGYLLCYAYQTRYDNGYRDDMAFMKRVRQLVPNDRPLLIRYDARAELETFWVLFYSKDGAAAFYDPEELRPYRGKQESIFVLARAYDFDALKSLGTPESMLQSRHTRAESTPAERRTLFRLRFDDARGNRE